MTKLNNLFIQTSNEIEGEGNSLMEELEIIAKVKKYIRRIHFTYISVIILFILGCIFYIDSTNKTSEEIFNEYYTDYFAKKNMHEELKAFLEGDFKYAIEHLSDSIYVDGKWLKILSMIEEDEYLRACNELKNINSEDSEWLRALCLMRAGNDIEAIKKFEFICLGKGLFSKDAKEILEKHYYNYKP